MTIVTLLRYLIGDREAILRIASNRHSLWIGLLFVLSAGFAREYDGEDLWHEPWHLLIPLGASLAASLLLFYLFRVFSNPVIVFSESTEPLDRDIRHYLSFLGLFWLTAPLAWLYAIPYERFLSAHQAIDLNLITLGIVALWRVALMVRVICVCTTIHPLAATGIVVGYGTALFAVISFYTNMALIATMGGLRTFEARTNLQDIVIGLAPCPAFLLGLACLSLVLIFRRKDVQWKAARDLLAHRPGASLTGLALFSVLGWAFVLPLTQPEQQRRRAVEVALRQERFADAVALLTRHPREAFPPYWSPPPSFLFPGFTTRDLQFIDILVECDRQSAPEWVQKMYAKRLAIALANQSGGFWDDDMLARIAGALGKAKGGIEEVERLRAEEHLLPWLSKPTSLDRIHAAMLDLQEKRELLPPPKIDS